MTIQQDSAPEPKTLAQMLSENLGAALRGEITAEQAQANADAFREDSAPDGEGLGSKPSALPTEQAGKPVLTVQAVAEALNNSEYREEGSRELWASMKATGLVAVFGASDDLMEFRGAIDDEVGAYNGTTVFLTPAGLLEECESDCPHSRHAAKQAVGLSAVWCAVGEPAWTYKTAIPHETFNVLEDGEPYCRGIVFDLAKALPQQAAVHGEGEVISSVDLIARTDSAKGAIDDRGGGRGA